MVEKAIVAILQADAAVTAIVKGDVDATPPSDWRINKHDIPQGWDLPAVTYQRISTDREQGFSGPIGVLQARVDVTAWAADYGNAKILGEKIRLALNGVHGTYGGVVVRNIVLSSEEEDNELVKRGGDQEATDRVYWVGLEFDVWFRESTS